jgi:cell wall-associated NlpC family hydrolase
MLNKNAIAATGLGIAIVILSSVSLANAHEINNTEPVKETQNKLVFSNFKNKDMLVQLSDKEITELQKQEKQKAILDENTIKMNNAIKELNKHVDKTWYVFAGSTPKGWDCSGLVRWTYAQMDIDLYHRAGAQKNSGRFVTEKEAKVGDLVSFGYKGYKGAWHIGIYIGDGKMIHSPTRGFKTKIQSVDSFGNGKYSEITYTRIIETN